MLQNIFFLSKVYQDSKIKKYFLPVSTTNLDFIFPAPIIILENTSNKVYDFQGGKILSHEKETNRFIKSNCN